MWVVTLIGGCVCVCVCLCVCMRVCSDWSTIHVHCCGCFYYLKLTYNGHYKHFNFHSDKKGRQTPLTCFLTPCVLFFGKTLISPCSGSSRLSRQPLPETRRHVKIFIYQKISQHPQFSTDCRLWVMCNIYQPYPVGLTWIIPRIKSIICSLANELNKHKRD